MAPATPHFPLTQGPTISAYENRSSAYRFRAKVLLSRFGTVSDWIYRQGHKGPFTVELFIASFFGSSSRASLSRLQASPLTNSLRRLALNEAFEIYTRFALLSEFAPNPAEGLRGTRPHHPIQVLRPAAILQQVFPGRPICYGTFMRWDRTEGLLFEKDYSSEPPSNRTSQSLGIRLYGPNA